METKSYAYLNRARWTSGEWDEEPDKIQWLDENTGYPCIIRRAPTGAWCGYVAVPESHPAYNKGYSDVDVEVHGGLTFANECQDSEDERAICHKSDGIDQVWWLGFDCSHWGDTIPEKLFEALNRCGTYKNVEYVKNETVDLAKQLKGKEVLC